MVESFDIQNLLQRGYYATSRAKTPREPSPEHKISRYSLPAPPPHDPTAAARSYQLTTRHRRYQPPAPSVEDEEVSLKREHGGAPSIISSEDDTPSRGEIEQNPIIMEVHEYNPERRFVILTGPPSSDEGEPDKKPDWKPPRDQKRAENSTYETNTYRRHEPSLKSESPSKPSSSTGSESDRPRLDKRKSRQDLPKLDTEFREDQLPEKYRNYPPVNNTRTETSRAESSRPENPPVRPPRPTPDPPSNPDVIKHGSGGREKVYHGYGQPQSSSHRSPTQRSRSTHPDDRRFDENHTRASSTSSATKRVTPNLDSGKSTRPSSSDRTNEKANDRPSERVNDRPSDRVNDRVNERVNDPRYRTEYVPPRTTRKERSPEYGKSDETPRTTKHQSRESESRLAEEHPKGPRELQPRRRKSIVHQEGRESLQSLDKIEPPSGPRLRPKGPAIPIPIPASAVVPGVSEDIPSSTRGSSTFPITKEDKPPPPPERPKSQLPYPVDDDRSLDPFDIRRKEWSGRSVYGEDPSISMPDIPLPIPIGPDMPHIPLEARSASIPPPGNRVPPAGSQSWQPPPFDPERDGRHLERPVGTVRRHSENAGVAGAPQFPDCRRKHPVAGRVDWLTLSRSDFNICPDCYEGVFANTEFRTYFQPMLRPSDRPISCDFGVSTWYRIAWLLTLKKNRPDLRLFHEVSNNISATQNMPCPGDRMTTRNWLTVFDPYTRRSVPDFTVCPQCARVIEALLPNLSGLFVPLDPRSEPTRGTCCMRFKDKRKRFVMYFDAMEAASDQARLDEAEPDIHALAKELEKMTTISECHEDTPIANGTWHTMQFLPRFTVCGDCFEEVVRPRQNDDNVIARNFYKKPERLAVSTCQLYSPRMREIFRKACRWNDPKYLEDKVLERLDIEAVIHGKLKKLDRSNHDEEWVEQQVDELIQEWKRWE